MGLNERRWDPLTGEWRVFATHRQDRTFLPPTEHCPLCPTVDPARPTEIPQPAFDVAVFRNRFPSLVPDPPAPGPSPDPAVYPVAPSAGVCEVVVYSDDHTATLAELGVERVRLVVDTWAERTAALGARADVAYVFVFENRGEIVGVTLHHPHGQIYGFPDIPPLPARELAVARQARRCPVCDVVAVERASGTRVVAANDAFVAYAPFAGRFPYEVHVAALRHVGSLPALDDAERWALAGVLHRVIGAYDGLFGFPLPYVMAVHQAPTDGHDWSDAAHLHIEFTPFHRRADRLKFLAGVELGAGTFLNDVSPDDAAAALRSAP